MVRTQIQLTAEQHRRLRALASDRGVSLAAVLRGWIDEKLAESEGGSARARRVREALAVCGTYVDPRGARDVAQNHDHYHLADAFGSAGDR